MCLSILIFRIEELFVYFFGLIFEILLCGVRLRFSSCLCEAAFRISGQKLNSLPRRNKI